MKKTRLALLHEDDEILVVDKPAGLLTIPSDPARAGFEDTCCGGARLPDAPARAAPVCIGVFHRLDRDTSGALALALSRRAHEVGREMFRAHRFERHYLTLVHGVPRAESGTISVPLSSHYAEGRRAIAARGEASRDAVTHYTFLEAMGRTALVALEIGTGRQHRIRAHLEHLGHPIIGEKIYTTNIRRRFARLDQCCTRGSSPSTTRCAIGGSRLRRSRRATFSNCSRGSMPTIGSWCRAQSPAILRRRSARSQRWPKPPRTAKRVRSTNERRRQFSAKGPHARPWCSLGSSQATPRIGAAGHPFVGPAGGILDTALEKRASIAIVCSSPMPSNTLSGNCAASVAFTWNRRVSGSWPANHGSTLNSPASNRRSSSAWARAPSRRCLVLRDDQKRKDKSSKLASARSCYTSPLISVADARARRTPRRAQRTC